MIFLIQIHKMLSIIARLKHLELFKAVLRILLKWEVHGPIKKPSLLYFSNNLAPKFKTKHKCILNLNWYLRFVPNFHVFRWWGLTLKRLSLFSHGIVISPELCNFLNILIIVHLKNLNNYFNHHHVPCIRHKIVSA